MYKILLMLFIGVTTYSNSFGQTELILSRNEDYFHKPVPPGGESTFKTFIEKNLTYPEYAMLHNISGKVFLQFTVSKEGDIRDIIVIKGIGYGCDGEAVRVLKSSDKWTAGNIGGHKKDMKVIYAVEFKK